MSFSDNSDLEAYCDDIDPAAARSRLRDRPKERLKCELTGLKMAAKNTTSAQKWSLAIAGLAYIAWTMYWVVVPESFQSRLLVVYLFYGILLGAAFGRLWDIQMDKIWQFASEGVNVSVGSTDSSGDGDDSNDSNDSN